MQLLQLDFNKSAPIMGSGLLSLQTQGLDSSPSHWYPYPTSYVAYRLETKRNDRIFFCSEPKLGEILRLLV